MGGGIGVGYLEDPQGAKKSTSLLRGGEGVIVGGGGERGGRILKKHSSCTVVYSQNVC